MRIPNSTELALINSQRVQMGIDAYKDPSEARIMTIRAIHNLATRDYYTWDVKSGLIPLAESYPGKPLLINHDWWDVAQSKGRILAAKVLNKDPSEIPTEANNVNSKLRGKINKDIIQKFGYWELEVTAWVDATAPIANELKNGSLLEVSIGALAGNNIFCPNSGSPIGMEYDDEFSNFFQVKCNHQNCKRCMMDLSGDLQDRGYFTPDELAKYPVINYVMVGEVVEAIELSFVNVPNVPGARQVA